MSGKTIGVFALVVALILLGYLLFAPVPIDPEAWNPPEAPALAGPYAPNNHLAGVELIGKGLLSGCEDVAVNDRGRIFCGNSNGEIYRFTPDGAVHEIFAVTGGHPLGLDFDNDGRLIVADAEKGLLSFDPDSAFRVLSTEAGGVPYRFTDDVDVAADGTIYFTDASYRFPQSNYRADIFEHRPNGRLLAYDPETGRTRVVKDGLYFANGVAVGDDQTYVLVNETTKYRILKVYVAGPKKGETEVFIDNLPGIPDGVSFNGVGEFWVALFTGRNSQLDALLPHPFLRKVVWRLPQAFQPEPRRYSFVLGIDRRGRVRHNLQDPGGKLAPITSAEEYDGMLYLGSLTDDAIGRIRIP